MPSIYTAIKWYRIGFPQNDGAAYRWWGQEEGLHTYSTKHTNDNVNWGAGHRGLYVYIRNYICSAMSNHPPIF